MSGKATPPVYGLVLAGGKSTRMQRDKATLAYHGGKDIPEGTAKKILKDAGLE